jgi:hypothetical protein
LPIHSRGDTGLPIRLSRFSSTKPGTEARASIACAAKVGGSASVAAPSSASAMLLTVAGARSKLKPVMSAL